MPMYRTSVPCRPAGRFAGPLVVSMRPFPAAQAAEAARVTARFPGVHGAPVHAGAVRAVLEPYVAKRLAGEVMLCVTGRENGIEDMGMFAGFAHFHIQALSEAQQRHIVASRMAAAAGVRKGEVTMDERVRAPGSCSPAWRA